jgi:glycolate oxidase iron-sulfur subunit
MDLGLDESLDCCVQCGLCLPHCPTFRVTGDESRSPRGRIALMRAVQHDGAPLLPEVVASFETCVQCRGCETACPSGVPFGHLIERTRQTMAHRPLSPARWQRVALAPLARPGLLRAGTTAAAALQRVGLLPSRLGLPRLPLHQAPLDASGSDVWLFTGCVMDAWQRDVHRATKTVLEATGVGVAPTGDAAPCCGALHEHAGLVGPTRRLAGQMIAHLDGDAPILVNSAGCGAAMKDYGRLVGTPEAAAFAARVRDVHEWLAERVDRLPRVAPLDLRVAVQDPCHLRHVQKAHQHVRTVLAPFVRELVELDDDGLCCGAGGSYSLLQPNLARRIRDRKVASIERAAPDVVVSANPGCAMHLGAGGVPTLHPMTLVARAIAGEGRSPA